MMCQHSGHSSTNFAMRLWYVVSACPATAYNFFRATTKTTQIVM